MSHNSLHFDQINDGNRVDTMVRGTVVLDLIQIQCH